MLVSEVSPQALAQSLRRDGINLRIGFCVARIRSPFRSVVSGIAQMYADYPLESEQVFADFHVSVEPPRGPRRWVAPQAIFRFDRFRPFKPLPAAQAYPLLEWGLNWCFSTQYHVHVVIHAAVLEKNGKALILPAPPGSGKSTLCAALALRGWRLLSDELTLLKPDTLRIVPMCRPLSLKNESLHIIQKFEPGAVFGEAVADTTKGTVGHLRAPRDSVAQAANEAIPGWVVFPRYQAGTEAELSPVPNADAFMRLAENTFNYSMLGLEGFHALANLVEASRCFSFVYSRLDQALERFDRLAAT